MNKNKQTRKNQNKNKKKTGKRIRRQEKKNPDPGTDLPNCLSGEGRSALAAEIIDASGHGVGEGARSGFHLRLTYWLMVSGWCAWLFANKSCCCRQRWGSL